MSHSEHTPYVARACLQCAEMEWYRRIDLQDITPRKVAQKSHTRINGEGWGADRWLHFWLLAWEERPGHCPRWVREHSITLSPCFCSLMASTHLSCISPLKLNPFYHVESKALSSLWMSELMFAMTKPWWQILIDLKTHRWVVSTHRLVKYGDFLVSFKGPRCIFWIYWQWSNKIYIMYFFRGV